VGWMALGGVFIGGVDAAGMLRVLLAWNNPRNFHRITRSLPAAR